MRLIAIPDDGVIRIPIMRGEDQVGESLIHLEDMPIVDAVPVVRCQNCGHCKTETVFDYRCEVLQRKVYLMEYCCWAERRADNG